MKDDQNIKGDFRVAGEKRIRVCPPGTHPVERAINFVVPLIVYPLTGSVISYAVHRLVAAFGWG